MRISTETFFRQFTHSLQNQQSGIAKLQEQLSYGRRVITPSDDPVGAARIVNIGQLLGRVDQFSRNADYATQRLGVEEATLSSVTNLMQRVRELAISASNLGTQSPETFAAIRVEVEQLYQEALNLGNTQDSNGEYLFSGFQGQTRAFSSTVAGVQYNGDQGQLKLQVGSEKYIGVSDSGYDIFMNIKNGNGRFSTSLNAGNTGNGVMAPGSVVDSTAFQTHDFTVQFTSDTTYDVIDNTAGAAIITGATYTDGAVIGFNGIETSISGTVQTGDEFYVNASRNQDVFSTLKNFLDALGNYPNNDQLRAQTRQQLQSVLQDTDQTLNHIIVSRAEIGTRLNSIDVSNEENESIAFELTRNMSDIRDLDYAEAISTLQFQLTSLSAAEQSFSAIQQLSLFDYIR